MTNRRLLTIALRAERDVVLARQRARQIAALLGFYNQDQSRIATATSEIARNAFEYGGGGSIEYSIDTGAAAFEIRVSDQGVGIEDVERILDGRYTSRTGMGVGIVGARRLMDTFTITSARGAGTTVVMTKRLRRDVVVNASTIAEIGESLSREHPLGPIGEVQRQNHELLDTLRELEARRAEVDRLNTELEETNRGVVALYTELDEKNALVERANSLKTAFLSDFSHEVRTPLNAVRNVARLLLDGYEGSLSERQHAAVAMMRQSADGLAQLVDDWLDLAKIEAGKIVVRTSEFDLAALFGVLRGVFRPLATSPDVSLTFEEPHGIKLLYTDEGKISQILRNLVSNALKFTTHGHVIVTAAASDDDVITIRVSDSGIGIAPEDLERVFEEFAQVENAVQTKLKGTGLGLSISRKLARLIHGDVLAESVVGAGTTFTLIFPRIYLDPELSAAGLAAAAELPEHA